MTQISDESFRKSVRNRIRTISIQFFNARPSLWDKFKLKIVNTPVSDSLKHKALSQIRAAIRLTKNRGEKYPDFQFLVDPIFLEQ